MGFHHAPPDSTVHNHFPALTHLARLSLLLASKKLLPAISLSRSHQPASADNSGEPHHLLFLCSKTESKRLIASSQSHPNATIKRAILKPTLTVDKKQCC